MSGREKNTIYMANNHVPTCVVTALADCVPQPLGMTWIGDFIVICTAGNSSITLVEVTELVSRRRALLKDMDDLHEPESAEENADDQGTSTGPQRRKKLPSIVLKMHTMEPNTRLVRPVDISTVDHTIPTERAVFFVIDGTLKKLFAIKSIQVKTGKAKLCTITTFPTVPISLCNGSSTQVFVALQGVGIVELVKSSTGWIESMLIQENIIPLGMKMYGEKEIIFSDVLTHCIYTLNIEQPHAGKQLFSGTTQGYQDGVTVKYNNPGPLDVYGKTVFLSDMSNIAIRMITNSRPFEKVVDVFHPFIDQFGLDVRVENPNVYSLEAGISILEKVQDFLQVLTSETQQRTGKRATNGPDMVIAKVTVEAFALLKDQFIKLRTLLLPYPEALRDICFHAYTTLGEEHFFSRMRELNPAPDRLEYGRRRQPCIKDDLRRSYQNAFSYFTGPRAHYPSRALKGDPTNFLQQSLPEDEQPPRIRADLKKQSTEMRTLAKEFGRGVRQQKCRDRTKEIPGMLPVAISAIPQEVTPVQCDQVSFILGTAADNAPSTAQVPEVLRVEYAAGEVVATRHLRSSYQYNFFLGVIKEDVKINLRGKYHSNLEIQWLEETEETDEDMIFQASGDVDRRNSPDCIKERVNSTYDEDKNEYRVPHEEIERLNIVFNLEEEEEEEDEEEEFSEEESEEIRPERTLTTTRSGRAAGRLNVRQALGKR